MKKSGVVVGGVGSSEIVDALLGGDSMLKTAGQRFSNAMTEATRILEDIVTWDKTLSRWGEDIEKMQEDDITVIQDALSNLSTRLDAMRIQIIAMKIANERTSGKIVKHIDGMSDGAQMLAQGEVRGLVVSGDATGLIEYLNHATPETRMFALMSLELTTLAAWKRDLDNVYSSAGQTSQASAT